MMQIRERGGEFVVVETVPDGGGYRNVPVRSFPTYEEAMAFFKKRFPDQPFDEAVAEAVSRRVRRKKR